jgi:heme-degrading monooxygenase HmoA
MTFMREGFLVVFLSQRFPADHGYAKMAAQMEAEVATIPGFLRMESVREENGKGITLSYWRDLAGIRAWREHQAHKLAKAKAKEWYASYEIQIYQVQLWNPA